MIDIYWIHVLKYGRPNFVNAGVPPKAAKLAIEAPKFGKTGRWPMSSGWYNLIIRFVCQFCMDGVNMCETSSCLASSFSGYFFCIPRTLRVGFPRYPALSEESFMQILHLTLGAQVGQVPLKLEKNSAFVVRPFVPFLGASSKLFIFFLSEIQNWPSETLTFTDSPVLFVVAGCGRVPPVVPSVKSRQLLMDEGDAFMAGAVEFWRWITIWINLI